MFGVELLGNSARGGEFVIHRCTGKAHRIGVQRLVAVAPDQRNQRGRIDAAREEHAKRHVGAQMLLDHLGHQVVETPCRLSVGQFQRLNLIQLPVVMARGNASVTQFDQLARQYFLDARNEGLRPAGEIALEILQQRIGLHHRRRIGVKQGLDFRSKAHALPVCAQKQWLDAEPVAHQQQAVLRHVVQRKRKHTVQVFDKAVAVFAVSVEDSFAIGMRTEHMAARFQLDAQLDVVVNLAVGDHA